MFFAKKPTALKSSARFSHAMRLLVAGCAAAFSLGRFSIHRCRNG